MRSRGDGGSAGIGRPIAWIPIALVLALIVGGCSAATFSKIDQVKKGIIQPRIDATYDAALKVWCNAPAATHNRAIKRNSITPRSLTDNCSDWRAIRDALIGSAMQRLIAPEIDIRPPE